MVKKQKKVSASVEARRKKRKTPIPLVKNNPFEVRVNRLKHQVMGQKIKTDRGVPGVSRSKSNEKVVFLFVFLFVVHISFFVDFFYIYHTNLEP